MVGEVLATRGAVSEGLGALETALTVAAIPT
jgi:hypothetical protein